VRAFFVLKLKIKVNLMHIIASSGHVLINGNINAPLQVLSNGRVLINGNINAPVQLVSTSNRGIHISYGGTSAVSIGSISYGQNLSLGAPEEYITQAEMDQLDAQLSRYRRPLPPPVPEVCIGETNRYFHKNENNERGFEVGVRFATKNHKNSPCTVAVYFYDSGGNPLRDIDGVDCCKAGNVAVFKNVTPQHTECEFKDFRVFVPFRQLHLQMGKRHDLAYQVLTWNGHKETSRSKFKTFYIDT
jgi:hypothetical protein